MKTIKVGCLVSYDFAFLKTSLPTFYNYVNEIVLAVDVNRKTWSGKDFIIPDHFWEWIRIFDRGQKIKIYEDKFFLPELTPMECETRERNLLSMHMGACDWYIQLDSDEYFVDFKSVFDKLQQFTPIKPVTVRCKLVTLFKQTEAGFLVIKDSVEPLNFVTNNPVYDIARSNNSGNQQVLWDDIVLHQSWARSAAEIGIKIANWGHRDDFNTYSFYKLWEAIDEFNYSGLSNFHPLDPKTWPGLILWKGSIEEILESVGRFGLPEGYNAKNKKKPLLSRLWRELKS